MPVPGKIEFYDAETRTGFISFHGGILPFNFVHCSPKLRLQLFIGTTVNFTPFSSLSHYKTAKNVTLRVGTSSRGNKLETKLEAIHANLDLEPRRIKSLNQLDERVRHKIRAEFPDTKYLTSPRQVLKYYEENWDVIGPLIEGEDGPVASVVAETRSIIETRATDILGLGLFDSQIRLVTLSADGRYSFVDGRSASHNIYYPSVFDEVSLTLAIDEFEHLLNMPKVKEDDFQDFFVRNPDFILNDEYKRAHPHVVLTSDEETNLIPDFLLEPVNQNSFCDLLELKLPTTDIFILKKNRERYSAAVIEAAAQLRTYAAFFDRAENRKRFSAAYPDLKIYKPRMLVIIGREKQDHAEKKREIQWQLPELNLRSYDEVLARMRWKRESLLRRRLG